MNEKNVNETKECADVNSENNEIIENNQFEEDINKDGEKIIAICEEEISQANSAFNYDCENILVNATKNIINYPYVNEKGARKASLWTRFVKRTFDFCSSLSLFLFLNVTLIFPILTIMVAIKMKGNPFFVQKRPGKNGKIFSLIKFRTMTNEYDENGDLLPDDQRMTKFGKMLRDTSLDELPELLNIIVGHMSVVGPRPQLVRDMVFFSEDAMRRQSVRGGLTGLAQTSGRNNLLWEERFDYDLEYVDNYNFFYDLKLIFRTIKKVVKSEDVSTEGMQTSEDYADYLLRIGAIEYVFYAEKHIEAKEILKNN